MLPNARDVGAEVAARARGLSLTGVRTHASAALGRLSSGAFDSLAAMRGGVGAAREVARASSNESGLAVLAVPQLANLSSSDGI